MSKRFDVPIVSGKIILKKKSQIQTVVVVLRHLHTSTITNFLSFLIVVEVRFVKKDDIYMSPCYGQDVCFINIISFRYSENAEITVLF